MKFEDNNCSEYGGSSIPAVEIFKQWALGGLYYLSCHYKWYLFVVLFITAAGWMQRLFVNSNDMLIVFLLSIAASVLNSALYFGLLRISTTGKVDLSYWRHFLRILPDMIIAFILFSAAAGIGFLFLLVPGFMIMTRFMFFPYLMLEYDISIREAFHNSQIITRGFRGSVFCVILFMLIASAAEIPFLYALYDEGQVAGFYYIFSGLLYVASILILKPLAIASILYGYAQMSGNQTDLPE